MQADLCQVLKVTFDRRVGTVHVIVEEGDDDIAVIGVILLAYDQVVMVQDTGIHHAVAIDGKHEHIVGSTNQIQGNGVGLFDIFHGQDGLACRDGSHEGHGDDRLVAPGRILLQFDGTGFRGIPLDKAHGLQVSQMIVDAGCR